MYAMNQHEELREKPPLDPATGQPTPRDPEVPVTRSRRSSWPLLVIILAGLILALIAWLPAELTRDAENEPVAPGQTETTPSDATPPAAQPAPTDQAAPTNDAAPTDQAAPPAGGTTAPAAPETQTPAAPETPAAPAAPATPAQPQSAPAQ